MKHFTILTLPVLLMTIQASCKTYSGDANLKDLTSNENISVHGSANCTNTQVRNLTVSGELSFTNLTTTEDLNISGSAQGKNLKSHKISVSGALEVDQLNSSQITISGSFSGKNITTKQASASGDFNAKSSQITESLELSGDGNLIDSTITEIRMDGGDLSLKNCTVHKIIIKKSNSTRPINWLNKLFGQKKQTQKIVIKGKSVIDLIIIENPNALVTVYRPANVKEAVNNGQLVIK